MKPLKIELLDKLFQYIYVYGVMSDSYKDKNNDNNGDGGGYGDDGNMCTLKEFLSS